MGWLKTSCVVMLLAGLHMPMAGRAADTRESGAVEMSSAGAVMASESDTGSGAPMTSLGLFKVGVRSKTAPVPMNQIHSWIIHVETPAGQSVEGAQISVSGGMPVHRHGLPTDPRVTGYLGNGDYLLEGMKFTMAGEWLVRLDITAGGKSDKLKIYMELP